MHAKPNISRSVSGGFTLIEVLMAMLIMTVGLLGLLQSVGIAFEHNLRNRLREEAVVVAEEQINNWRIRRFDDITGSNTITKVGRVIGGRNTEFTVARQSLLLGSNSKRLGVAVRWTFKNVTALHEVFTLKNN